MGKAPSARRDTIFASLTNRMAQRDRLIKSLALHEQQIGKLIRDYRTVAAPVIQTTTLADHSGVHRTTAWTIESGHRWTDATESHAKAIIKALPEVLKSAPPEADTV